MQRSPALFLALFLLAAAAKTSSEPTGHGGDTPKPPLMLAKVYESGVDLADYWVSEKLDGVRAYWNGSRLLSRNGNVFPAPDWFVADFPKVPLDGELWGGRGTFDAASAADRADQFQFGAQLAGGDACDRAFRIEQGGGLAAQRIRPAAETGDPVGQCLVAGVCFFQEVVAAGITINGLPILCRFCQTPLRFPDLAEIYRDRIIGGPGAFVVTATSEADLAEAIRRKLILEITGEMPSTTFAGR